MKNEIICYAQGYDSKKLANFINSFNLNVRGADLIIITKNTELKCNQVTQVNSDIMDLAYKVDTSLSPYTLKVIYFYLYCKHISKADNVFLCDCTDVFFNQSPFGILKDKVSVFTENELIKNCLVNTEWVKLCYNQDILNLLYQKPIINGGLILGNRIECLSLLKEMCVEISGVIGRIGNYRNLDQAVLNKVVYFDELKYNIESTWDAVNCAHLTNTGIIPIFKNNKLYLDDFTPHIVHQYPCFKNLEVKW